MTRLPYDPHNKMRWWLTRFRTNLPALGQRSGKKPASQEESRLQQRLKAHLERDRTFWKVVRRKRSQPGQLAQRLNSAKFWRQFWRYATVSAIVGTSLGGTAWTALFVNEKVTLGGVPYRIVNKFWHDKPARDAFFGGDRQALHDQLKALGIEKDIKDFYRDRFDSEHALDLYIHQLMYNRTGYIGEAYTVDMHGRLQPRVYSAAERAKANGIETDGFETDNFETDNFETDNFETNSLEANRLKADSLEADSLEADSLEADSLEADNPESSSAEIKKARLFGADIDAASGIE
jgi:hypothetical protein